MFGIHKNYHKLFESYIFAIEEKDRIAILYHTDCDGVCSCAIIKKTIHNLLDKDAFIFTQKCGRICIEKDTVELLKREKINKLIIVDMAVDETKDHLKEIENFADILIIDHHIKKADLNSSKTIFIKAEDYAPDIDSSKYPASKLCFDFAKPLIKSRKLINDLKFMSSIGISGDAGYDFWTEKGFLKKQDKPKIQKADRVISAYFSIVGNYNNIANILQNDELEKNINKLIIEKREISQYYFDIEKELQRLGLELDHKASFLKDKKGNIILVFYRINSRYNIKSTLSNKLSFEDFPESTVIIEQNGSFSARNQSFKISMNDMIKCATKNIKGSAGGGHIPAAGGFVPKDKIEEFHSNVVEFIQKKTG